MGAAQSGAEEAPIARDLRSQALHALSVQGSTRASHATRTSRLMKTVAISAGMGVAGVLAGPALGAGFVLAQSVAGAASAVGIPGVLGAVNTAGTVVTGVGGLATATVGSVLGVSGAAVARVGAGALSAWEGASAARQRYSFKGIEMAQLSDPDALGAELTLVLPGFLSEKDDWSALVTALTTERPHSEIWAVLWACGWIPDLSEAAITLATLGETGALIANPLGVARNAVEAGALALADVLVGPLVSGRPVTVFAHSLGCDMLARALSQLQSWGVTRTLKDIVLLGGTVPNSDGLWRLLRDACTGRVVNVYSRNDKLLQMVFTACLLVGEPMGGCAAPTSADCVIDSFDCSDDVTTRLGHGHLLHLDALLPAILTLLSPATPASEAVVSSWTQLANMWAKPPPVIDESGRLLAVMCHGCGETSAHVPRPKHEFPFDRAVYACTACKRLGEMCFSCQASTVPVGSHAYCPPCASADPPVPEPTWRGCSWCHTVAIHACSRANRAGRDSYVCCACDKPTVRCNGCVGGMAKSGKITADELCVWCNPVTEAE